MFKVQSNAQCLQQSLRSVKLHINNFSRRHKRATEDDEKESPDGHKINLEPNFWEKKCSHLIGKNFFFRPKNRKTEATKHFRRNINPVFFPVRLFRGVIINSNECFCPRNIWKEPGFVMVALFLCLASADASSVSVSSGADRLVRPLQIRPFDV